jgi:hypothetical protein
MENISGLVLEELDYSLSFGYEKDIEYICTLFSLTNIYKLVTCSSGSDEIIKYKKMLMKTCLSLKMEEEF